MLYAYGLLLTVIALAIDAPAVTIDGKAVHPEAWAFLTLTRGGDNDPKNRSKLIEQLIDRELIRGYLEKAKVVAEADVVELRLIELEELIRRRGSEPAEVYARLGLSVEQLKKELALGVAWEQYVEQKVTPAEIQKSFDHSRAWLDGTRVHAHQIFRKAPTGKATEADLAAASLLLKQVRADVLAGKRTFADAAREFSESPSGKEGGDIGWIVGLGQLPTEVAQAALSLKPGEISVPERSPLGVHLVMVTEREEGQLSLEDVRPQILQEWGNALWSSMAAELRQTARIVRPAQ